MLHADAVKAGDFEDPVTINISFFVIFVNISQKNTWMAALDAPTLDGLITEMNSMNRYFAKVICIKEQVSLFSIRNKRHFVSGCQILG